MGFTDGLANAARTGELHVVLISAFFYAAVAAKLVDKKAQDYTYTPAETVIAKLQAVVDGDDSAKDQANAARLITRSPIHPWTGTQACRK